MCFNAPVWGLRCATIEGPGRQQSHDEDVSMPRCGAFGVRRHMSDQMKQGEKCFNAPVWGLRCATVTLLERSLIEQLVSMPRCGAFGVRQHR